LLRRPSVLVLSLVLALALAGSALAANVKVRVEGRTTTLYGKAQPTLKAANALEALDVASTAGEFHYALTTSSFGTYVSQVGKYAGGGSNGWVFKVNGVSPPVGADQVQLRDGDVVLWYWAAFGPTGGPPTLELRRTGGNCYRVDAVDDTGRRSRPARATLVADGKRFRTRQGRACIGKHKGLVRAVAPNAVRSNAVR
jgi:hypothetical protein